MDPNQEIENIDEIADDPDSDDSVSVDDFIKQLEEKEKDLHITANTTIIEIAESFEDEELPEFLRKDFEVESADAGPVAVVTAIDEAATIASTKLEIELAGLKDEIENVKAERDELLKASQRRAKDFENFKSRTERERNETFQTQVGNLATQMLPALDNLNRAVDFALEMPAEQRVEIQQFLDGIVLVNEQVNEVLAEMGILPIATVGEAFDPHFHEAVATEASHEFGPNIVSAEVLRGYRIGERVIRHSMVKVAMSPASEDPVDNDAEDEEHEVSSNAPDTPPQTPDPADE